MGRGRITYQDWIVELGRDPALGWWETAASGSQCRRKIIQAVNMALVCLSDEEALFIRRFYFQGMGYRQIGEITGREIYRLEGLHRKVLKKLKFRLVNSVSGKGVLKSDAIDPGCSLCRHPQRQGIDRLIKAKKKSETWQQTIRTLRREYGIRITTPQVLIGHQKYHMI